MMFTENHKFVLVEGTVVAEARRRFFDRRNTRGWLRKSVVLLFCNPLMI